MGSISRIQLEDWIKRIELPAMSQVLDIGGSQLPINKRLGDKGEGSEFTILDLEEPHICEQKPDIIADIQGHINTLDLDKFDTVLCLEVSEYWYAPYRALCHIHEMMKSNGILYISFHFVYPVHNPPMEDCLRYTPLGAIKLLEKAGFEIVNETPRIAESPDVLRAFYSTERMRPSKIWTKHDQVGSLIKAKKI